MQWPLQHCAHLLIILDAWYGSQLECDIHLHIGGRLSQAGMPFLPFSETSHGVPADSIRRHWTRGVSGFRMRSSDVLRKLYASAVACARRLEGDVDWSSAVYVVRRSVT